MHVDVMVCVCQT